MQTQSALAALMDIYTAIIPVFVGSCINSFCLVDLNHNVGVGLIIMCYIECILLQLLAIPVVVGIGLMPVILFLKALSLWNALVLAGSVQLLPFVLHRLLGT